MLLAPGPAADTAISEAGGVPAGLLHYSHAELGVTRVRRGKNFAYRDRKGPEKRLVAMLATLR